MGFGLASRSRLQGFRPTDKTYVHLKPEPAPLASPNLTPLPFPTGLGPVTPKVLKHLDCDLNQRMKRSTFERMQRLMNSANFKKKYES